MQTLVSGRIGIINRTPFLRRHTSNLSLQFKPIRNHGHQRRILASMQTGIPGRSLFRIAKNVSRALVVSLIFAVVTVVALPTFVSWPTGLNTAVWIANRTIPGKLKIRKVSLGWTKPVNIEGISLEDTSGEPVLRIQKIFTYASLFSIVTGRSGLGDCTITSLWMNLLEDQSTGISRLSLAIEKNHKKVNKKKEVKVDTSAVTFTCDVKCENGGLQLNDGKVLLPSDVAAALGDKMLVDILVGKYAANQNDTLQSGVHSRFISPVHVSIWSDCLQAQAAGFFNPFKGKLQLINPIKVEMDLTPEVGRIYLGRVNPLLGYIVGPAVVEDDMPDVVLRVFPKDMEFPAEEYKLRFEPMRVVLGRGPVVDGILRLFSKGKEEFTQELTMETSSIEAEANMNGVLNCRRIDLLIGGRIHVATWGLINLIEERMNTQLVVPQTTLRDLLGFSNLPKEYHLQIPVRGSFERPEIDIKSTVIKIAQLTLRPQAQHDPVPEPIDTLPWETEKL